MDPAGPPAAPALPDPAPGPADAPGAPPEGPPAPAPLARPRAATFLLVQLALLPVALAAQALQPGAGLVWTQLALFALPAAALPARLGLAPAPFLRLARPAPRALLLALPIGAAAMLVGGSLQALWASLLPDGLVQAFDVAQLFRRPPWERHLMIAAATGLAPICEEIAFRGHLLSALRLRTGPRAAIALSALVFAGLHLDPVRLPGLLFLGALYGWLTWRSGSVYPAVLAHAVNNAAATALALGSDMLDRAPPPPAGAAAASLLVGVALLALPLLAAQRLLPPAPEADAALSPRAGPAGRLPGWVVAATSAAVISLVVIALAPRR